MANTMKKTFIILLAIGMLLSLTIAAFAEETTNVAKIGEIEYATLAEAVAAANEDTTEGTVVEIVLLKDLTLGAQLTIKRAITITGAHTITRGEAYTGTLFTISKDASLTLEGVIIDGNHNWTFDWESFEADVNAGKSVTAANTSYHKLEADAPIVANNVFVINGSLVLNNTTIQNHSLKSGDGSSVFYVANGGYLETNNALITKNHKAGRMVVANVAAGGKWIINKGTEMSNNYCQGGNGGLVRTEGTVIINDGLFTRNASIGNGSIFMNYKGTSYMELNDGLFTENYCLNNGNDNWNGVIHCHYDGGTTFVMNGGIISNNYGSYCGGLSASKGGTPASITINAGTITNNGSALTGKDASLGQNITIAGDATFGEVKAYRDVTVADGKTMTVLETLYLWRNGNVPIAYNGGGTVDGNVYLYNGVQATMYSGSWLNGRVTVNAIGTNSTLFVKPGAVIDGVQVRVLNSVASGDYTNADESAAAQAAAYVKEEGATVKSPVLFFHRLTSAQKSNIVVTFDYNGGLDAQNWSGCQLTSAEAFAPVSPAPTKEGYVFAGWAYADDNNPETLSMATTGAYNGEEIAQSLRLVAQWSKTPCDVTIDGETYFNGDLTGGYEVVISGGEYTETVTSNEEGKFNFSEITFNEEGTYIFEVVQTPGEDTTVTYDETVYTVTVTVAEGENGQLEATVVITVGEVVVDEIVFENYEGAEINPNPNPGAPTPDELPQTSDPITAAILAALASLMGISMLPKRKNA